ncbi:MAG: 50S ribosomal protein L24 [bacterium]
MYRTDIKKDDFVVVNSGKERGKKGKILKVLLDKNRVIVEKVNFVKKHSKPQSESKQGGIIEKEGSVHLSNVMLFCGKCGKGVRTRNKHLEDGSKVRLCAGCGESFD